MGRLKGHITERDSHNCLLNWTIRDSEKSGYANTKIYGTEFSCMYQDGLKHG